MRRWSFAGDPPRLHYPLPRLVGVPSGSEGFCVHRKAGEMKVFVTAAFYPYEGYSEPDAAFATKADAEAHGGDVFELEVCYPRPTCPLCGGDPAAFCCVGVR
jgi:hypothetical protein